MFTRKSSLIISITFVVLVSIIPVAPLYSEMTEGHKAKNTASAAEQKPAFPAMPEPGKKVSIGNDEYMIYEFTTKPKLGMVVVKIQVFNKNGEKDTSLAITVDTGMPSMPSMGEGHETFKLSKNGDYLTPIDITMPGDWEIKVTIMKAGKVLFRGSHLFDV